MRLAVCLLLTTAPALSFAVDPPDVAELKKQLAAAEAKVAELRAKLAAADEPKEFKDTKFISPGLMKVGEKGQLSNYNDRRGGAISIHKVLKILGDDTVLLQPDEGDNRLPEVIVKGFSTKGIADGHVFNSDGRVWKVVGTEKYGAQTLMVIRPDDKPPVKVEPPKKGPIPKKK